MIYMMLYHKNQIEANKINEYKIIINFLKIKEKLIFFKATLMLVN